MRHYCNNGKINKFWYDETGIPDGFVNGHLPMPKEVKERKLAKTEATNLSKYGVKNTFNIPSVLQRSHSEDVIQIQKNHREQTKLLRYGDKNWSNNEQAMETMNNRDGVGFGSKTASLKRNVTVINKYGYLKTHFNNLYKYDNIEFDSSWELIFYIYCKENGLNIIRSTKKLEYVNCNGKVKHYEPDFEIDGKLIEIKGDHLFKNTKSFNNITAEKLQCMKDNNVIIITSNEMKKYFDYFYSKYDKSFIDNFRVKQF